MKPETHIDFHNLMILNDFHLNMGFFQNLSSVLGLLFCIKVDQEMIQQIIDQFQFYQYLVKSSKRLCFPVCLNF